MAKIYIDGLEMNPERPYEFIIDGTESYDKGVLKFINQTDSDPIPDYAEVKIELNNIDYEFIRESDITSRTSQFNYTHPLTLIEPVLMLKDVQIPDRAFSTHAGSQVTWLYMVNTVIETSNLDYIIDAETQTLLNVEGVYRQFSTNFLGFLVDVFRSVDIVPKLSLNNVIGHNKLNERNNDISASLTGLLETDKFESKVHESNINDYASSTHSKIKNGAYEENLLVGTTYYPSKSGYVSARSSNEKYNDTTAQIQFDSGIKRVLKTIINFNVNVDINTFVDIGDIAGDIDVSLKFGSQFVCKSDNYYSNVADMTLDTGDNVTWVYDSWYKNIDNTAGLYLDIDVSEYVISKETWNKLKISPTQDLLLTSIYKNNSIYFNEGEDVIENLGTEYDVGFFANKTTYYSIVASLESKYTINIAGVSASYNDLRNAKWNFKYIPMRSIDTEIERHTSERVKRTIVKTNQQSESRVEMGKFGQSNWQYVNRQGNDKFQVTIRYFEEPILNQKGLDDMYSLNDYIESYKIVIMKFIVGKGYTDVTYSFVKNQSNINQIESFTTPDSPFTIQDKLEVNTCYIRKHYAIFGGTELDDNTLNTTVKDILWNKFNYSITNDTPIYSAVYTSADSDEDINLSVQKAIEGRGFTLNAQFKDKTVAGNLIEATGFKGLAHAITPINYTDANGEVEDCIIHYCNEVLGDAVDFPIVTSYTTIFGDYTRTVSLQPNEILGETTRIECITDRENLFIYKNFLLNNSLLREIGEGCTLRVYYYNSPIFTTDTSVLPSGWITNDVPIVTAYKIILSGNNLGYSYAIADSVTGELYFSYNNYGIDLLQIKMSLRSTNPNLGSVYNLIGSATATGLATVIGSGVITKTKDFYYISASASDLATVTGAGNLEKTYDIYYVSASATNLDNITGSGIIEKTYDIYYISAETTDVANLSGTAILNKTKDLYVISAEATEIANISGSAVIYEPYYTSASAIDIANITATAILEKTKDLYYASASATNIANVAGSGVLVMYIISATATGLADVTGSTSITYPDIVEWVEVSSGTVTGGDCVATADIGNIKEDYSDCVYIADGSSYTDSTNLSTPQKVCSDGATYTLCVYDTFLGVWNCQDYIGTIPLVKFECQLI